jgi:hypothetical protein
MIELCDIKPGTNGTPRGGMFGPMAFGEVIRLE